MRFHEKADDGRLIAAREAGCGRSLIIACGGDGTISEGRRHLESGGTRIGNFAERHGGDLRAR